MTKATAKADTAAMKAAAKKITTKPYKHKQTITAADVGSVEVGLTEGVDTGRMEPTAIPLSSLGDSTVTTETTETTTKTAQDVAAEKAKAAIAAKEAKIKAQAEAKAKAEALKAEAKAKAEALKVVIALEREDAKAKRDAEKAAAAAKKAEEKANKPPRERAYEGSMLHLSERQKSGAYVKGTNGQMRSTDDVALALDAVPAEKVVPLIMEVFQEKDNKYGHLNYGQQSMNFRNRLRGAIRKELEVNGTKITLDHVKSVRDSGGYVPA